MTEKDTKCPMAGGFGDDGERETHDMLARVNYCVNNYYCIVVYSNGGTGVAVRMGRRGPSTRPLRRTRSGRLSSPDSRFERRTRGRSNARICTFVPSLRTLIPDANVFPPLTRWAKLCRPLAGLIWAVSGGRDESAVTGAGACTRTERLASVAEATIGEELMSELKLRPPGCNTDANGR